MQAKIDELRNGAVSKNGETVTFEIGAADGSSYPFSCSATDIERLVLWLIGLAQLAATNRPEESQMSPPKVLAPIEARRLALVPGRTPDERMVAVDLAGLSMVFAPPASELRTLQQVLAGMESIASSRRQ